MAEKFNFPITELNRDKETLSKLGFYNAGLDFSGKTMWRVKIPYYHMEIQVVLGDYPKSNPNCGVLSVHTPAHSGPLLGHKTKKTIHVAERTIPIAWYVDNFERLHNIIISLTQQNI